MLPLNRKCIRLWKGWSRISADTAYEQAVCSLMLWRISSFIAPRIGGARIEIEIGKRLDRQDRVAPRVGERIKICKMDAITTDSSVPLEQRREGKCT